MPLSPIEVIKFEKDDDRSDELLLYPVLRFLYLSVLNPAELGTILSLGGAYTPTTNETLIAKQQIKDGRWERAISRAAFANVATLLPNANTAADAISGLKDGSMHADVYSAMQVFSPLLAAILAEDLS